MPESPQPTVLARLRSARERLDAKDLPGAMAVYEEILAAGGDRPDVMATISGDLGSTGYVAQIVELIAPRYDIERHGPATGMNLLQAYLAVRDPGSAQHILDLLFSLNRPDLEGRLYGFSNAIAEVMLAQADGGEGSAGEAPAPGEQPPAAPRVALVTISRPVWLYGLEPLADRILPGKAGRPRRISFAQLALPKAYADPVLAMTLPEDELGRLSRTVPVWLAENFSFSPDYSAFVALGFVHEPDGSRHPMVFGAEWTTETIRQLVDTTEGGLDYVFTGSLTHQAGDYELVLRVWEVKKYRERKRFSARWTPGNADAELAALREAVCTFMEWAPASAGSGISWSPAPPARSWLDTLGASLNLFLTEKQILPASLLPPIGALVAQAAGLAPSSEAASLAWITLERRCRSQGIALESRPERLFDSALVTEALRAG